MKCIISPALLDRIIILLKYATLRFFSNFSLHLPGVWLSSWREHCHTQCGQRKCWTLPLWWLLSTTNMLKHPCAVAVFNDQVFPTDIPTWLERVFPLHFPSSHVSCFSLSCLLSLLEFSCRSSLEHLPSLSDTDTPLFLCECECVFVWVRWPEVVSIISEDDKSSRLFVFALLLGVSPHVRTYIDMFACFQSPGIECPLSGVWIMRTISHTSRFFK